MVGDHVFPQFPKGSWWLAWTDHALLKRPVIHAVLAPLDQQNLSISSLRHLREKLWVLKIERAMLPILACGDIYHDGRPSISTDGLTIKSVCDFSQFGEYRNFTFDTSSFSASNQNSQGYSIRDVLSIDRSLKAEEAFPLTTTENSKVLVVDAEDGSRYIIPAAEILRSMVAPHSRLLSGLFGEHLYSLLSKIINLDQNKQLSSDQFNLSLRQELDESIFPYIANMVRLYNPHGAVAINRLFPSLRTSDPLLQRAGVHGRLKYVQDGASLLPICFPFGANQMTISAKCIVLGPKFYLVAKIIGGTWPVLPSLQVISPASEVDRDLPPVLRGRPMKSDRTANPDPAEDLEEIDLIAPPSTGGKAVAVGVEDVVWQGLPPMNIERKKMSRPPTKSVPIPPRDLRGTALGDADSSGTRHRGQADHADRDPPNRFRMTHDALDRLVETRKIGGHREVSHVDIDGRTLQLVRLRGLDVWALPTPRVKGWATLPTIGDKRRSRTLLLRRVVLLDRSVVYWISIEVADDDGRHAVLIGFEEREVSPIDVPASESPKGSLSRSVGELVALKGRITDKVNFEKKVGASRMRVELFRHGSGRFAPSSDRAKDQSVAAPERLNDDRVLAALSQFWST